MIYVDSSVVLAFLFGEGRAPIRSFWALKLVSSRILEYEVWNRVNDRRVADRVGGQIHHLFAHVELLELSSTVLERALHPFPIGLRTLGGLHLASMDYLRKHGQNIELASYDRRLNDAARALGIPLAAL